eukprot:Rhum_TRINITY_DN8943_c0_g1::Rhum_TRINITY_DN8943_c0_g1_i1::g.30511::m.30511
MLSDEQGLHERKRSTRRRLKHAQSDVFSHKKTAYLSASDQNLSTGSFKHVARRRRRRSRVDLTTLLDAARTALGSVSPAALGIVVYCAVAGFLLVYWHHLSQRLSVVNAELARLQGHEKVQGMERVELSRLVLQRIYDDYSFVLGESDRAAHMRNVTATAATAHLVFHQILPELYYGVEMANNVSSHSPRPDQFHDLLLALSKKSPGSVGSAQWKFKRESQIRYHTGPPLRLSSTKVLPPTDRRDGPARAQGSSAPASVLSMVAAMLPFRGGGGGGGDGAGSAASADDSAEGGGYVRGSDGGGGGVGGGDGGGDGGVGD